MLAPLIASVLRGALVAAGGGLITSGALTDSDINLIAGALSTVAAIVWKVIQARRAKAAG